MAAFINTNIASLNAQRNLTMSQSALQTSIQRLSSGLRINSAKDDAAGLAIAERFTTQINGLDQAGRNANDGISLAQTADGALSSVSDNLQRIRELSVQAANSTNSASDRAAINQEVQQRLAEIDRTTSQTSFNGQKILDGSFGNANFQVGANAGETISVGLNTSMRTSAIGAIATTTTTGAIGAAASGGNITTGAITPGDFSVPTALQADGSNSVVAATRLFGTSASAGSGGVDTITYVNTDFSGTGTAATGGNLDITGLTGANEASGLHFDVDGNGVTINGDYSANDATAFTSMASDIQTSLNSSAPGTYTVTSSGAGDIKITNVATGSTSTAPAISFVDAAATTAGFSVGGGTATGGADATSTSNAAFTVDGNTVTLSTNLATAADAAAEIQSQLGGGYTVTNTSGQAISITNNTIGSGAVVIGTAGTADEQTNAANAGFGPSTGTAGTAAVSSTNATFTVDGSHTVNLTTDEASYDALAADIQTQLGGSYTATNDNGTIKITNTGSLTAVAITAADANATSAGFAVSAGTAGTAATTSTALSFDVDGTAITLNGNDATVGDVATELQGKLDTAFGSGAYTAVTSGSGVKITNTTAGSNAVAISAADSNAIAAGFADGTGTAGVTGGTVTLTDFSIKSGDNTATSLNGTYDSVDDLAAEINKSVSNVYATVSNGKLALTSSADITLSGADATGTLGFGSTSALASNGSLNNVDTLTAADANDAIQRVDSALTSVNGLRSTFGAIQNRFESVISNLSATSENLSAARSRIQDADFAAETANMTRAQILQQAGTAMLAQANSLPNGVLALLR